ncbi:hypothetical protein PAXINDRAFT_171582 [Paxillus involutus ATCC 200175]|uniref:Unplaced genomic scaffold PAXINscaffold_50, whole genome shotgun sequence n=1 Tax=Paxillus involutus ATCC 200175 TaxID=664439 RepID=A0A0C9TWX5_PAXIN|nr:hypothetical protein PAXINDRAFT_171582 [Paxillus involutus ATCC 200175]
MRHPTSSDHAWWTEWDYHRRISTREETSRYNSTLQVHSDWCSSSTITRTNTFERCPVDVWSRGDATRKSFRVAEQ